MSDVEKIVRDFYENYGWVGTSGQSGEDLSFRQFSPAFSRYSSGANARAVACFSELRGKLLIAGGGDLPASHITVAEGFTEVTCLDISQRALDIAKGKLGTKAEYLHASILNVPCQDNSFDAVFCAHVIFHIDIELQEKAIRELIRVTKQGGRVVIIYFNPDSPIDRIIERKKNTPILWRLQRSMKPSFDSGAVAPAKRPRLYAAYHPLNWWNRFQSECDIHVLPWIVMGNYQESQLLWTNPIASLVKYPALAAKWWSYPMFILDKKVLDEGAKVGYAPSTRPYTRAGPR